MYLLAPAAPNIKRTRRNLLTPLPIAEALAAGTLVEGVPGGAPAHLSPRFSFPGVDVTGDGSGGLLLRLDAGIYSPEVAGVLASAVLGREIHTPPSESLPPSRVLGPPSGTTAPPRVHTLRPPTADELRTIREGHVEGDVEASEIMVVERWVTNNAPDRWRTLRFTSRALAKMAADFADGRSQLLYHDTRKIVGRIFAAEVVTAEREGITAEFIKTRTYIHVRDSNADLLSDLKLGILAYDSIGFMGGVWTWQSEEIDVGGETLRRSWIEVDHDEADLSVPPLVAAESSFVYIGRMRGTGNSQLSAPPADVDTGRTDPEDVERKTASPRVVIVL